MELVPFVSRQQAVIDAKAAKGVVLAQEFDHLKVLSYSRDGEGGEFFHLYQYDSLTACAGIKRQVHQYQGEPYICNAWIESTESDNPQGLEELFNLVLGQPPDDARSILGEFCGTVEATGGVFFKDGTYHPRADSEWTVLADIYLRACKVLGVKPAMSERDKFLEEMHVDQHGVYKGHSIRKTTEGYLDEDTDILYSMVICEVLDAIDKLVPFDPQFFRSVLRKYCEVSDADQRFVASGLERFAAGCKDQDLKAMIRFAIRGMKDHLAFLNEVLQGDPQAIERAKANE